MDQFITIHVGQAGVQLSNACWELFCLEHDLNSNGTVKPEKAEKTTTDNIDAFFNENDGGKYTARSVFVDLEPTAVDQVRSGPYKQLFQADSFITGKEDTGNNAIRGHYTLGKNIVESALERVARQVDKCLFPKAFLIFNSIGGGTGSGVTSLIMENLRRDYPSVEIQNFNIFPSERFSTSPVEPYNAILNIDDMSSCDKSLNFIFENERMYKICSKNMGMMKPTYTDINRLVAQVAANITAPLRFESSLSFKMNELSLALTPKAHLNTLPRYVVSSYIPMLPPPKSEEADVDLSLPLADITKAAFDPNNYMADCDPFKGKYIGMASIFRGDPAAKEVVETLKAVVTKDKFRFGVHSSGMKIGLTSQPSWSSNIDATQKIPRSHCVVANTTSTKDILKRIAKNYDTLYKRRAFVHWFVGEGLSEGFFAQARETLACLISQYEEEEAEEPEEEVVEEEVVNENQVDGDGQMDGDDGAGDDGQDGQQDNPGDGNVDQDQGDVDGDQAPADGDDNQ